MNKPTNQQTVLALTCLAILAIVFLAFTAKVRGSGSDPQYSLLVSQAILTTGSVKLNPYMDRIEKNYKVTERDGNFYYSYPIGTPIWSLPFVAVALSLGEDMVDAEFTWQMYIASFTGIVTFLLLLRISLYFVQPLVGWGLSAVFLFGTSYASTTLSGLWSHNFSGIFILLVVWLLVEIQQKGNTKHWYWIGILLGMGYMTRPTLALLTPAVLFFFLWGNRTLAVKTLGVLALTLVAYFSFNYWQFGTLLTSYNNPSSHFYDTRFFTAIFGHFLSPSRGLIVFSPFLVLPILAIERSNWKDPLYLFASVWAGSLILLNSIFPCWWGGYSFGPRLLTETIPGFFLLTLLVWPKLSERIAGSRVGKSIAVITVLLSVWIHSYQGLYNLYTAYWNPEISADDYPEVFLDWKYPQFLHSRDRSEKRQKEFALTKPISLGETIQAGSFRLTFHQWHNLVHGYRFLYGNSGRIAVLLDRDAARANRMDLELKTLNKQNVKISANGKLVRETVLSAWEGSLSCDLPEGIFQEGENEITFEISDGSMFTLGLKSFRLESHPSHSSPKK